MLKQLALVSALVSTFVLTAPAALASPLPAYPFVHVTADASRYTTPNIGAIDFQIAVPDADPAAARATVETRIAEVRALLQAQGIPETDLETRDIRREPRTESTGESTTQELRLSVHLVVRNLSKWRAVVGPLLVMPNLTGFGTSFDLVERDAFEAELMTDALRDARRRADIIAKGARRKLGAVTAVTPGAVKNLGGSMGLARTDFSLQRSRPVNLDARDFLSVDAIKLMQPVDVVFRLE